jgi:hypothetical protein
VNKINKKEFLLDDNKIRNCYVNVSKMNIFEYIKFYYIQEKGYKDFISNFIENFKDIWEGLYPLIVNILCLVLFPATMVIKAIICIRYAKKKVKHKF